MLRTRTVALRSCGKTANTSFTAVGRRRQAPRRFDRSSSRRPPVPFKPRAPHARIRPEGRFEPTWAVRPLELVRDVGRPMLVLEDPGGEPLERLLGACCEDNTCNDCIGSQSGKVQTEQMCSVCPSKQTLVAILHRLDRARDLDQPAGRCPDRRRGRARHASCCLGLHVHSDRRGRPCPWDRSQRRRSTQPGPVSAA
jgi:hypothetical protein